MSNWSATQLTDKGRALDAKVTAGMASLTFTKMKLGSGIETAADIPSMTDLTAPQLVLGISSCAVSQSDDTICELIAIASSENVQTSFVVRELGVFATDPDDGEILYAVMLDSNPDTMPNHNVASPVTVTYQVNIMSSNASSISAVIDPAGLVSVSTLNAAINTHNTGIDSHADLLHLRRPSTAYAVGDIAYSPLLPSWARLECVTAGTTDTGDLPITAVSGGGGLLSDGSVLWIIDDVRDCTPIGAVRGSLYLPSGYVLADGATVYRADYPRLVRLADTHNLWTNDTTANAGLFGVSDGSTTMVLPNWIDRMAQMAASAAGASVAAGLPNITGMLYGNVEIGSGGVGAFKPAHGASAGIAIGGGSYFTSNKEFDASLSNSIYGNSTTVQPPAIKQIPILRY